MVDSPIMTLSLSWYGLPLPSSMLILSFSDHCDATKGGVVSAVLDVSLLDRLFPYGVEFKLHTQLEPTPESRESSDDPLVEC